MLKLKSSFLLVFVFLQITCYSQNSDKQKNTAISRFQYEGYNSLQDYIHNNAIFLDEALDNTGVLLAGIVLDKSGEVSKVFTLNSLVSSVDKSILALLEKTEGHWKPLEDTINHYKIDTILIPIVYRFMGQVFKIDRANCKLTVQKEVELTKLINGQPVGILNYESTKLLIKKYDNAFAKGKYDEASNISKELVRREPLNTDFYSKLILVNMRQGRKFAACNNLKYVQNYLVIQPDISILQEVQCN
jgi:hypothetical protein